MQADHKQKRAALFHAQSQSCTRKKRIIADIPETSPGLKGQTHATKGPNSQHAHVSHTRRDRTAKKLPSNVHSAYIKTIKDCRKQLHSEIKQMPLPSHSGRAGVLLASQAPQVTRCLDMLIHHDALS